MARNLTDLFYICWTTKEAPMKAIETLIVHQKLKTMPNKNNAVEYLELYHKLQKKNLEVEVEKEFGTNKILALSLYCSPFGMYEMILQMKEQFPNYSIYGSTSSSKIYFKIKKNILAPLS